MCDFEGTFSPKNSGFDYKEELNTELDYGLNQVESIINTINLLLPNNTAHTHAQSLQQDIWLIMHPEIIRISKSRFESGFYADAVVWAFKEINVKVRELYKRKNITGNIEVELIEE